MTFNKSGSRCQSFLKQKCERETCVRNDTKNGLELLASVEEHGQFSANRFEYHETLIWKLHNTN